MSELTFHRYDALRAVARGKPYHSWSSRDPARVFCLSGGAVGRRTIGLRWLHAQGLVEQAGTSDSDWRITDAGRAELAKPCKAEEKARSTIL